MQYAVSALKLLFAVAGDHQVKNFWIICCRGREKFLVGLFVF